MAGVSCVRVVPPPPSPPRVPPVPVVSTAPPLVPPNPPPAPALLDERARLTFALMSGYRAPFAAPKSFAAAWASAQDCRVAGLLRSARSTTSVSENVDEPVPAESAARAAVAPGAWGGVGGGGGVCAATATVHGTAGLRCTGHAVDARCSRCRTGGSERERDPPRASDPCSRVSSHSPARSAEPGPRGLPSRREQPSST